MFGYSMDFTSSQYVSRISLSLSLRERLVAPCRPIADGSTHGRSTDAMTRLSDAMTVQLLP